MKKIFLILLLILVHHTEAKVLEINGQPIYNTKPFIQYSLGKNLTETVDELKSKQWYPNKKNFNSLKNSNLPYWAKIEIKNISNSSLTYYLKAENQFTYHIEFFLVEDGKVVKHIEDGVISKNRNRAFNTNHMIFPLTIKAHSNATIYFKIKNYNKIDINFILATQEYLTDYYQTYNIIEGIFFGGMIVMTLYNLFLYFLLKFRAYLYYVAYVFWLTVYFIGLFGFSQRYFEEYTWIFYISSGAFFTFLTLFVQSILNLKEKLPIIHKILNIFILYFIVATVINITVLEAKEFIFAEILFNLFFTLIPIFISIIIGATYYLAYRRDSIAKFYSIVWSSIALIGLLLPLEYLNIFTLNIPSDYIFQFLTLFEVLCFSFILSFKIKLIEQEKKKQEKLLVQQNKLASMGEMISIIAHQWRQPLSEINGTILNMDIDYRKDRLSHDKFNHYLDGLESTTAYMSSTINDFMNFFKKDKKFEQINISDIISSTLNLILTNNRKDIDIIYNKEEDIELISYKSELIQALLILINNAIDACCETPHRESKIIIETKKEKNNLIVTVKDNGSGIPKDILDKIYNPYFTTKHESKGTGLGLYILKMIIEQTMHGKITIESSSNGTICNISIPRNCDIQ